MRPQKPFPAGTTERMRQRLTSAHSLSEYRRIQSIYFRAKYGYSAVQIADMVGLKIQTIRNLHAAYLKEGEAVLQLTGKGGRHRSNLSVQEEDALLSGFEVEGKLGDIVEVGHIHRAYVPHLLFPSITLLTFPSPVPPSPSLLPQHAPSLPFLP